MNEKVEVTWSTNRGRVYIWALRTCRGKWAEHKCIEDRTMQCRQKKYIQQSMKNKQKQAERYRNGVSSVSREYKHNSNQAQHLKVLAQTSLVFSATVTLRF